MLDKLHWRFLLDLGERAARTFLQAFVTTAVAAAIAHKGQLNSAWWMSLVVGAGSAGLSAVMSLAATLRGDTSNASFLSYVWTGLAGGQSFTSTLEQVVNPIAHHFHITVNVPPGASGTSAADVSVEPTPVPDELTTNTASEPGFTPGDPGGV